MDDQYASDWDKSDLGTEISENSGGTDNTSPVTGVHPGSPTRGGGGGVDAIGASTEEQIDETIKSACRVAFKDETPPNHENPNDDNGLADHTLGAVHDMSMDVVAPSEEQMGRGVDGTPEVEERARCRTPRMGPFIAPLSEHRRDVDTLRPQVTKEGSAHDSSRRHSPLEDIFAGRGLREGEGRRDGTQKVQEEVLRVEKIVETSSNGGNHRLRSEQGKSSDNGSPTIPHKAEDLVMPSLDTVVPCDANTSSPKKIPSRSSQQPAPQKTTQAAEDSRSVGTLGQTVCRVEMVNQDVTSLRLEQSVENALLSQDATDKTSYRLQDGICSATSLWSLSLQQCRLPSLLPVAGLLHNLSVLCSLEVNGCTGVTLTGLERVLEDAPCLRTLTLRRCGISQFQPPLASGSIEVSQSIACVRY